MTSPDRNPQPQPAPPPVLPRTMGLWALVIYGVGDMLGSGVYALMGKYAGAMGNAVWLAFLASMVAAMLTGLSYASLGSRYPRAAGAAFITQHAYGLSFLAYVVGLAVLASGLTSMGTATRGFAGYVLDLMNVQRDSAVIHLVMLGFIAALTFVNFWGMRESNWLNAVCTTVEVSGLLIIVAVGVRFWGGVDYLQIPVRPDGQAAGITLSFVLSGAVLTFYSFVGFEDMLNVSEEVIEPERTFPKGLLLALLVTTVIYMAVAITAVSVVPFSQLAGSKAPMVDVMKVAAPSFPPVLFTAISVFAIANTALLNYIMGSRLAYGMARQGLLPGVLGKIHPWRKTPHVAIAVLAVIVIALTLAGDISSLASATSLLLLGVFVIVNGALVVLKFRKDEPRGRFEVPWIVPAGGVVVCASLIVVRLSDARRTLAANAAAAPSTPWLGAALSGPDKAWQAPAIAIILITAIAALYIVLRPRIVTEPAPHRID